MKRTLIVFIVTALVLVVCGILYFSSDSKLDSAGLVQFGVVILVAVFAFYIGIRRFLSVKKGEPSEDELSRKVMQKTSSISFYISLYLWLLVMYFSDKVSLPVDSLIGAGIVGMAVVFAICWLIINLTGIKNE